MTSLSWDVFFPLCLRADPLSNMVLSFSSKEDAIAFAEKNGKIHKSDRKQNNKGCEVCKTFG